MNNFIEKQIMQKNACVSAAIKSYEQFHEMSPGSATEEMVKGSSAGIDGWTKYNHKEHYLTPSSPGTPDSPLSPDGRVYEGDRVDASHLTPLSPARAPVPFSLLSPFTPLNNSPSQSEGNQLQPPCLSEDQERVMKDILDESISCVYVDGGAGTGKSFVIAEAVRRLRLTSKFKHVHVVAPTGIAAENVEGRTIHSFFGIRDRYSDCRYPSKFLETAQCIIVDEISMVSAETLDLMDKIARRARGHRAGGRDVHAPIEGMKPFGGLKMIFVGDLFQLLPVNKEGKESCPNEVKSRGLVFNSSVWKSFEKADPPMRKFSLTTSMRHQGDPFFIDCLNKIRNATLTEHEFDAFKARLQQKLQQRALEARDGSNRDADCKVVYLYPTTTEVNDMNLSELEKLDGKEWRYANFRWQIQGQSSPSTVVSSSNAETVVRLRKGAQVMLTKNMNVQKPFLVNGSRGIIIDFVTTKQAHECIEKWLGIIKAASADFAVLKDRLLMQQAFCQALMEADTKAGSYTNHQWPVVRFQNGEEFPILPLQEKCLKTTVPQVFEMIFPLQLAWAITIHKSQGLTIDRVHVDFARTFNDGMIYTALSRVRSMDGLHVENFQLEKLRCSDEVKMFFENKHPSASWHENPEYELNQVWEYVCEPSPTYTCPSCNKLSRACEKWANGGVRPVFNRLRDQIREPRWTEIQELLNRHSIDISILSDILREECDPVAVLRREVPEINYGEAKKLFAEVKNLIPLRVEEEKLVAIIDSAPDSPTKRQKITHHVDAVGRSESSESCGDADEVYVLRLQQGKYYVGKTNNLERRLQEHRSRGHGCAEWTKIYPMLDTVARKSHLRQRDDFAESDAPSSPTSTQQTADSNAMERTETLLQIKLHGIENVRGAKWVSVVLTEEQKREVEEALCELEDRCFGCGAIGHMKRDCLRLVPAGNA